MFRRIVIFLASLLFLLNSALVNASIGGWTLSNPTAVGASILYDGTKGSLTSSVLISPNASQVAKVLRGGIAGIALSYAVKQLLGAVDWVLEPANNRVTYYEKPPVLITLPKIWIANQRTGSCEVRAFATFEEIKPYIEQCMKSTYPDYSDLHKCELTSQTTFACKVAFHPTNLQTVTYGSYTNNPAYNPNVKPEEKYLSLITAAQQVIENAQNNNLDAQFAVLAAATNILSEAEQDDAKAKPIEKELEDNADDKCRTHNAYMNGQARIIEDRYNELFVDSYDLYNKYYALKNPLQGVGSWEGHIYRYVQVEQPILRQRILDAALEGCYETPNASRWKQKSPPPRPGIHSPG
ncbi:hypothetical protein [Acinetobacter sp. NyZ410]|uniref:hypothetical protein n=1 Tax=Acinetobacter sp. NyZ410 TaxID=2929509 RepID=UPI001FB88A91|nr:hypothetical protein [Acinetobacter sp. NyZ410]UOH17542.1 hypothetical protein MTO68_17195 [Acinetobacter sp. NyZ410]